MLFLTYLKYPHEIYVTCVYCIILMKGEIFIKLYIYTFLIFQNAYIEHREVKAAQGVKIAAKDLEKAIAGTWFTFKTKQFFIIFYFS